jgi:DNA-directed RNA polymerase I, II, and III subunit RPABC2
LHKEDVVIAPEKRTTSEIMSQAEYARVVSERAKQIENGSPIFISLKNDHNPIKIAEKEIKQKKCPLKITRYLTKNIKEEWLVNEMVIPFGAN